MATLVLGDTEVRALLDYPGCIERLSEALRELSAGRAAQPLRWAMPVPGRQGLLGLMPASLDRRSVVGAKVLTVYPENRELGRPSHQGVVALFDLTDGSPTAVIDAASLTEIRTAAVSALASRLLARDDASVLAVLGAGAQGEAHGRAIPFVRPIREVRVWDRHPERARALADRLVRPGLRSYAVAETAEAAHGAQVICTTTASHEPILEVAGVDSGAHVNAVGAASPGAREISSALVKRARLFVDRLESAWAEADDLRVPLQEGLIGRDHVVGELGDLLLGTRPGRSSGSEVTLFKSVGLAVEDLAAASYLVERARAAGRGTWVELTPSSRRP